MPTGLYHRIKRNSGPIGELAALLKNADAVVVGAGSDVYKRQERLLDLVWGYDYEGDIRTVDVHIQKLRKKLGLEDCIKTVYKLGYRLEIK